MTNESGQRQDIDRAEFLLTLRQRGIGDQAVLRAMEQVPRAAFVPGGASAGAHADQALPIDCGQTISQPYVVAYMTERLALKPHHRVLEIGTGSGYQAAILSKLAREVVSIERFRTLADHARDRLRYAAGNFYVNDKPTGAVVGQQPFGGARASGTNDKAGSMWNLIRWVSPRSIKETFTPAHDYRYPFMDAD